MPAKKPKNIYVLLDCIRQRPGMYIGEVGKNSLHEIHTMCYGYSAALRTHGVRERGVDFNREFADYLAKRFGWSTCCGWAHAIREHSRSSRHAFEVFYGLLDEFRKTHA